MADAIPVTKAAPKPPKVTVVAPQEPVEGDPFAELRAEAVSAGAVKVEVVGNALRVDH